MKAKPRKITPDNVRSIIFWVEDYLFLGKDPNMNYSRAYYGEGRLYARPYGSRDATLSFVILNWISVTSLILLANSIINACFDAQNSVQQGKDLQARSLITFSLVPRENNADYLTAFF